MLGGAEVWAAWSLAREGASLRERWALLSRREKDADWEKEFRGQNRSRRPMEKRIHLRVQSTILDWKSVFTRLGHQPCHCAFNTPTYDVLRYDLMRIM